MTPQQKDILTTKLFDSPSSLTQEDIEAILADKELLELYQTAVLYRDSKPSDIELDLGLDMDKEWDKMSQRLGLDQNPNNHKTESLENDPTDVTSYPSHLSIFSTAFWKQHQWRKYAAIAAAFVSITAIAAITTRYIANQNREFVPSGQTETPTPQVWQEVIIAEESTETPTSAVLPEEKIFEDVTLEDMAKELSEVLGTSIYVEDNVKNVRLYLRLPQGSSVEDLLSVLGQYESLSISREGEGKIFIGRGE